MNLVSTVALVLFCTVLQAQPLDSLVQLALRQNPDLQSRYTRYQSQLERVPQESQLADPRLDFSTQLLPLRNRTWEQAAIIGGMQEFPWPGTLATRSALVISESRVVYAQAEVEALELAYEVRMAWLEYYQAVNSIKILEEGLNLSRSAERLALARIESGRGNATEVLKVQLELRQREQEIKLLKNRLKFPLLRLNQLLNRPADTPLQVQETLQFEYLPLRVDSLLAQIKRDHPALNSLRYEKEASRQIEALNRLEGKPDLGIGLDYVVMSKVTEHGLTSAGKDMLMPRIGLRLPLYRKKYEAKAREEQLRREGLDMEAQALSNDFTATIGQALALQEEARLAQEFVQEQLKTLDALIKMQEGNFSTDAEVYESLLENYQKRLEYQLMELEAIVKTQQAKVQVQKLVKP
jgi:outer membrane protein TolC